MFLGLHRKHVGERNDVEWGNWKTVAQQTIDVIWRRNSNRAYRRGASLFFFFWGVYAKVTSLNICHSTVSSWLIQSLSQATYRFFFFFLVEVFPIDHRRTQIHVQIQQIHSYIHTYIRQPSSSVCTKYMDKWECLLWMILLTTHTHADAANYCSWIKQNIQS